MNWWQSAQIVGDFRHVPDFIGTFFLTEYGTVHQERSHLSFPLGIRPENPNHSLGLTLEKKT